ncbi:hypothetical protein ACLKA6_011342 [Drosophila palustris]
MRIEAFILPHIITDQPAQIINNGNWKTPKNRPVADPQLNKPGKIDMLIGAEHYYALLLPQQHKLMPSGPMMQQTKLGHLNRHRFCGQAGRYIQNNSPLYTHHWKIRFLPPYDGTPKKLRDFINNVEEILLLLRAIRQKIIGKADDAVLAAGAGFSWVEIKEALILHCSD